MKMRAGFVTNSSSTSFLIIARDELEEGAFLDLVGVAPDSPIADLFRELFQGIIRSSEMVDLSTADPEESPEEWFDTAELSPAMIARLHDAAARGLKAYFGSLSSDDESAVEAFFCMEPFELENDRIYFNYLRCVW